MLNLEKIGSKISKRRKELNMTQNDLADSLFVTHQAVSKWENGKALPTIDLLYALTNILDLSIDYLLDDSEIKNDDYETLFKQLPRKAVIKRFLDIPDKSKDLDKIFYLLNKDERTEIINQLINNIIYIDIIDLWHLLSTKERTYLLTIIINSKYDYDLNLIRSQLSNTEQALIKKAYDDGRYNYFLINKGVIIREKNQRN